MTGKKAVSLPDALAIFPLPGALLLPGGRLPLNIFEPRYINMIDAALAGARMIGMIQPAAENDERLVGDDTRLFDVGCVGRIIQFAETDDGRYQIVLDGLSRFRIARELETVDGFRRVKPDFSQFESDIKNATETPSLGNRADLLAAMERYFEAKGISADETGLTKTSDSTLVTTLAMSCPFPPAEKQALLECADLQARGVLLAGLLDMAARTDGETPSASLQ